MPSGRSLATAQLGDGDNTRRGSTPAALLARLRIVERLDRLAAGNPGDAKPVGRGVWELRLRFGPGYRVYYLHDGSRVILLLCGGDKSTQQRDIDRAYQLAEEYWSEEGRGHG